MWTLTALRQRPAWIGRALTLAWLAACLALAFGIAPVALAAGAQLNATLQPSKITLDEAALLGITLQGTQAGDPRVPQVNGLTFTPTGQSSAIESVNGVTTASLNLTYRVTATAPGRYTIPGIRFQGATTTPLTLEVLPAGKGAAPGAAGPLPSPALAPPVNPGPGGAAFVQLITPKRQLVEGESLPVQIRAGFRSDLGVNVDGPPALKSDAFTLSNLSSTPQQSEVRIKGVAYTTLSWFAALVPIKKGQYAVSLDLPVTLQIHQAPDSLEMPDLTSLLGQGGFGSSLLDDSAVQALLGKEEEQSVTLAAPAIPLSVSPLPAKGQPADFTGAVGSFQLEGQVSAPRVAEGDPLTVTFTVQGTGNFDRVATPGLKGDSTWKTYRPQITFTPRDSVGREGTKSFAQTVVPTRAGHLQLPAIQFSYFDPKAGEYVVRQTQPLDVTVTPGATPVALPPSALQASNQNPAAAASPVVPSGSQLAPLMSTDGPRHATLIPIVQRAWFAALPGIPLAVMAGGLLLIRRREWKSAHPVIAHAAREAEVKALLSRMDAALRVADGPTFIGTARRALQVRLAERWSIAPGEVTLATLDARLDASWDPLRQVFVLADRSAYGGWRPQSTMLAQWQRLVHEQLQRTQQL